MILNLWKGVENLYQFVFWNSVLPNPLTPKSDEHIISHNNMAP